MKNGGRKVLENPVWKRSPISIPVTITSWLVVALAASVLSGFGGWYFFDSFSGAQLPEPGATTFWLGILVFSPVVETAIAQSIPYIWFSHRRNGLPLFLATSVGLFFLLHVARGLEQALVIVPVGAVFAAAYWYYGQRFNNRTAAVCVIGIHAIYNACVGLVLWAVAGG